MAVTNASVWVIHTAVLTHAVQQDHQLCLAVLRGLVGRVRHIVGRMEDLALRPVTARLANFLLNQAEAASADLAHPAITRTLIANHLATTPESISRSLRVLEQAGAIRFDRQQIIIVAPQILRDQAKL
jgi:CRP/FNR family transcriptional regulator